MDVPRNSTTCLLEAVDDIEWQKVQDHDTARQPDTDTRTTMEKWHGTTKDMRWYTNPQPLILLL